MTSRRSTLRQIRQTARAALRVALHVRPARPAAPPRAVAPAVVAAVAAVVGLVIATGNTAEAGSMADERPAATAGIVVDAAAAPGGNTPARPADIARAMQALDPPSRPAADSARASRSSTRAPLHRWVRPNGGPLSSPFGYRWGRLHAGIDLAGPYGSPILAATDGCISYAGPEAGYGEVMKITDWDGTQTLYGHMSSFVRTSGCVTAGEEIARVGSGGDATGAHLHFGVYVNGSAINPIPFLAKHGVYI